MKRRIFVVLLVLVVIGAVVWRSFFMAAPPAPPDMSQMGPMPVSVAVVLSREVTEYQTYSGRLEAMEQAVIQPRVEGTIEAVHFSEGAMVKAGDLLFTLDPRPLEAALTQAQATLTSASASASFAQADFTRVGELLKDGFVAKRDYDTRRNAAAVAAAELNAATAAVRKAKLDLDYTKIRAPITGRVSRAELTVGNVVSAAPTPSVLTTIVASNPIYADFAMDEPTYLAYVAAGQTQAEKAQTIPVQISLAGNSGLNYSGTVKAFDNQINTTSGTIRVRAILDNASGALVPGMYALVRIAVPHQGASLLVAEKAINTDQAKKFVYIVGADSMVSYRPVEVGGTVGTLRIIKSGVQAGEKIVVNGLQRAQPGAPVAPTEVPMEEIAATTPASPLPPSTGNAP